MESPSFGDQGPSGPPREDHTGARHDLEARRHFLMAAESHHSQNSLPAVDDVEDCNSATGLEALTSTDLSDQYFSQSMPAFYIQAHRVHQPQ
jgi:hypothetical protein